MNVRDPLILGLSLQTLLEVGIPMLFGYLMGLASASAWRRNR